MRRTNQVRQMSPPRLPGRLAGGSRQQEPSTNDQLFQRVQEMFEGKVEGEVVYMVLQEFDWNVEKAVDSLSVMCGDTLDPEVKQSKLAEIAKDILLSEKKQLRYTHKTSQGLSASDFPALTPNNANSSSENSITSQFYPSSGPKTSDPMSPTVAASSLRADSNRKMTDSHMSSGPSFVSDEKKNVRKEAILKLSNLSSVDEKRNVRKEAIAKLSNLSSIDDTSPDDYWPKLGDPSVYMQPRLVGPGVIGEKRGRSGGSSVSPRYRAEDAEGMSQSSDSSKATLSGHVSKYDTWIQSKRPVDNENNIFPSFHSDQGKPDSDFLKSNSKLQSSFDSIDDIDDDFEDELNLKVELKQRHSSGTTSHSQGHHDAIGQSILSGALMLSDYSVSNQADDNKLMPNSPIETDSCDMPDIGVSKSVREGDITSNNKVSSYIDQMNLHGFWFKDNQISSGTSSMPTQTLSPSKTDLLPDNAGDRIKSPVIEVSKSSSENSNAASRYNFATPTSEEQNLNRLDSLDFDDIETLLKTFKEENYNEEKVNVSGKSNKDKGGISDVKKAGLDDPDMEMKLPVLSFELSVEAKEFVPRQKKEDAQISDGSGGIPPKFFLPKMMRHERPPTTSPPRLPLMPPGMPPPRPPFSMPLPHWPPPPTNARLPFPGQMSHPPPGPLPPRPPFPGFHDPGPRGPYASMVLRPGQMLPPRRAMPRPSVEKGSFSAEIERVREKINSGKKCLIILRGLPGSGKSTLARDLEAGGCTLTTDDFFMKDGQYNYDVTKLSEGHEWNKKRAAMAMEEGFTPVIIDNTNTQAWEMKPYAVLAMHYDYEVEILEPNTEWKFSLKDLEKRNSHKVPRDTLKKMKERYQHNITVESILGNKFTKDSKMRKIQEVTSSSPLPDSEEDFPALPKKSDINVPVDRKGSLEAELAFDTELKDSHVQRNVENKRGDTMYSPIPGNIVRPGKGLSPVNLHKQLEMISARKMLMSPPVSVPAKKVKDPSSQGQVTPTSTSVSSLSHSLNDPSKEKSDQQESEIDSMVNDLIKDQIGSSFNKDLDYKKATEELKAFLHIMPIEPENLPTAEAVIDRKMSEIVKSLSETTATNEENTNKSTKIEDEQNEKVDLENSWHSLDMKSETQSTDNGSEGIEVRNKGSQNKSENKSTYSIGSDLDLEKIEDSAILNDLDNMSSVSGEMEKLSLASQLFENTLRQEEESVVKDEKGEVPKPQRERRVRNHSQSNEIKVENFLEEGRENSTGSGHQAENCKEGKVGPSTVTETEAKYWGNSETDAILQDSGNESYTLSHVDNTWHDPKPKREKKADIRTKYTSNGTSELKDNGKLNSALEHAGSVLKKKLTDPVKDHNFPVVQRVEDLEKAFLSDMYLQREDKIHQLVVSSEDSSKTSPASISPKSPSVSPKDEIENSKDEKPSSNNSAPKKRKGTRRKMAAKLPFLSDDSKEVFKNTDWANFNVKATSPEKIKITESKVKVIVSVNDCETQVTSEDFRLLRFIENEIGICKEEEAKFLHVLHGHTGVSIRENSIPGSDQPPERKKHERNDIVTIDRGTFTDEGSNDIAENLEFLHQGFPNISRDDLKDILLQCGNDVQWASDLILDWKFDLSLSEEDTQKFVEALRKVIPKSPKVSFTDQSITPKKDTLGSVNLKSPKVPLSLKPLLARQLSSSLKQAPSLFDICKDFVEKQGIASKDEIERQVIASAQQRLNSMEENIRVARQNSAPTGDEIFIDDDFDEKYMQELLAIAEEEMQKCNEIMDEYWKMPTLENVPNFDVGSQSIMQNGETMNTTVISSENKSTLSTRQDSESMVGYSYTVPNIDTENLGETLDREQESAVGDLSRTSEDGMGLAGSDTTRLRMSPEGLTLPLEIPGDFTRALISLFGPVKEEFVYMADKVQIQVDFEMARKLHACLKTAEEIRIPRNNKKQLQEVLVGPVISSEVGQSPSWSPVFTVRQCASLKNALTQGCRWVKYHAECPDDDDEAMARKLQSEIYRQTRQPVVPSLTPIKAWSQTSSDISSVRAVSLAHIMEEQQDNERKMKEYHKDVAASGTPDMLATKMKLKKLNEEFPGIDESVICDIFQANCFSYEDTAGALRSCLDADYRPLKTYSNKSLAAKDYETNIIEAAKQQSLSEMLNSCLYQSRFQNAENPEYGDIRGEANLHYRLRHQCFQKAQDAHRKGMREVATFYARQGHLHTQKIKEANMRAADKILAQRNQYIENSNTIDLHGLHVDEAKTILQQVIERRELELQQHPDKRKRQLFIITGRGNHSRGGIARLKPAVINFLQQGQYRFTQVHQGMLKLQLSV